MPAPRQSGQEGGGDLASASELCFCTLRSLRTSREAKFRCYGDRTHVRQSVSLEFLWSLRKREKWSHFQTPEVTPWRNHKRPVLLCGGFLTMMTRVRNRRSDWMHTKCPKTVWGWPETKWLNMPDTKRKTNKLWNSQTEESHSAIEYHDLKNNFTPKS